MANDEIKEKIVVDAGKAIAELKSVADANKTMAQAIKEAGKEIESSNKAHDEHHSLLGKGAELLKGYATGIAAMATAFLSFEGVKGMVTSFLDEVAAKAERAAAAVQKLGPAAEELARGVGAMRAAKVEELAGKEAVEFSLGEHGKESLLKASATWAQTHRGESRQDQDANRRRLAALQELTGGSESPFAGAAGATAVSAIEGGFKYTPEKAANVTAMLGIMGYDPDAIAKLGAAGPFHGSDRLLQAALGAREAKVDPHILSASLRGINSRESMHDWLIHHPQVVKNDAAMAAGAGYLSAPVTLDQMREEGDESGTGALAKMHEANAARKANLVKNADAFRAELKDKIVTMMKEEKWNMAARGGVEFGSWVQGNTDPETLIAGPQGLSSEHQEELIRDVIRFHERRQETVSPDLLGWYQQVTGHQWESKVRKPATTQPSVTNVNITNQHNNSPAPILDFQPPKTE